MTSEPGHKFHDLVVARIIEETADACSVVFEIPEGLKKAFSYRPGQFLTLKIPYQGKTLLRCYSLASSPDCDREHKVTVKRVDGGRISNWINDELREGDTMSVLVPGGLFTLSEEKSDLLLFSGGSGITPVISIVKSALVSSSSRIKLVYANRDNDSVIFNDELSELAGRYRERFEVVHSLDSIDGFLDAARVKAHAAGWLHTEVFICGPGPFMDLVEGVLLDLGVATEGVHVERFESPPDELDGRSHDPRILAAQSRMDVPALLTVHLDGVAHRVPYQRGQTVLGAVKQAGLEPPFNCTDGFCGCCMATLEEGEVMMVKNDFLSPEDLQEGWVLTCQSCPMSVRLTVRYPD